MTAIRQEAIQMLKKVPEDKLSYVIQIMQGINEHPEFTPNAETLEAFAETDEMIRTSRGQHFKGSAEDFFAMLDAEE